MGDLMVDTAVERVGEGRYRAHVSRAWEIWGPMGGYVASLALRAAGAEASFARPASFSCHYLSVAAFDVVDIEVTRRRAGRNAEAFRVSLTQGDRAVLDASAWAIAAVAGLDHTVTVPPAVPPPHELAAPPEEPAGPRHAFDDNVEYRPVTWSDTWPPPGPLDPAWRAWMRFTPRATFADPWADAARSVVLLDLQGWPSAYQHHAWRWGSADEWVAPNLDLHVAFHAARPADEWLLADGHAPVGGEGLIGWNGRVWSADGALVASGGGQLLCRRVNGTTPAGSHEPTARPGSTP